MAKIKRVELLPEDNLDRGTYIDHPKGRWVLVPYEKWQRIFYRDEPMPDLEADEIVGRHYGGVIIDDPVEASGVNTAGISSGLFTKMPPARDVRITTEPVEDQEELDDIVDKAVSKVERERNSESGRRGR